MVLGSCGSGKSCCVYSMMKNGYVDDKGKSIFDEIIVYLGTLDAVDAFKRLPCKNLIVLNEFDADDFEQYLEDLKLHQMERLEKGQPPLNTCIIFDDFLGKQLMKPRKGKSSVLEHLLVTSRHEANCSIIYCAQIYKSSSFSTPTARNNMTHWIIYRMSAPELEKIAEDHCGLMSKDEFIEWYNKVMMKKHSFITIDYKKPIETRYAEGFTKTYTPRAFNLLTNINRNEAEKPVDGGAGKNAELKK